MTDNREPNTIRHHVVVTTDNGSVYRSRQLDDYEVTRSAALSIGNTNSTNVKVPTKTSEVYVPTRTITSFVIVFDEPENT